MCNRQYDNMSSIVPIAILGIIVIVFSQISFADEFDRITFIAVSEEKFEQPQSKYSYQEIVIFGYIEDYSRGSQVIVEIVSPDESQTEVKTYASKKGVMYIPYHITDDSQIGTHQIILKYHNEEIASTSFEILENK